MRAVGVDACRSGWVAIVLDDGQFTAAHIAASLEQIVAACPAAAVIGADMPLGLLQRGWRQADELAAARLGAYRSRVFRMPPRAVWDATSHREAAGLCRQLTDPPAGFSVQAWGLKAKLRQAAELRARLPHQLFEVHPELSFAAVNGGMPIAASKKTWNGQMTRRTLLADMGIHLPGDLAEAGTVQADDILDAAAAAWSASRIASGHAVSLPDPPQLDEAGYPIAIWH
jgi:predicted RNase H-like nuclease